MTDFDEICAECKALHKDHYTDENGKTVKNCDTCPISIYEDDENDIDACCKVAWTIEQ